MDTKKKEENHAIDDENLQWLWQLIKNNEKVAENFKDRSRGRVAQETLATKSYIVENYVVARNLESKI